MNKKINLFKQIGIVAFIIIGLLLVNGFGPFTFYINDLVPSISNAINSKNINTITSNRAQFGYYLPDPLLFFSMIFTILSNIAIITLIVVFLIGSIDFLFGKRFQNTHFINLAKICKNLDSNQWKEYLNYYEPANEVSGLNKYLKYDKYYYGEYKLINIDPNWPINDIIFGFLREWNIYSFLGHYQLWFF